ncbi:MAG: hypothetical protein RIT26_596 [Pseudomonadota bacterium]|jgi:flagellar biosynthesis/type III secretory pathway chaperone
MTFKPLQLESLTDIQAVQSDLAELRRILMQEFEALKKRDLLELGALEASKTEILTRLDRHTDSFKQAEKLGADWLLAREDLTECRDLHFKNLQLLRRQLDIVQGTLQVMLGDSEPMPTLYDRLGQVGASRAARAWQSV